jgi:hypothetical protein
MAKNQTTANGHPSGAIRKRVKYEADGAKPSRRARREILFPTEPTSIPREEIDRAIDAVMSRKK